ncbi:hypothetical protein OS175_09675 [Marinicella sp. S1101]|uniref:hypothetical protein n=1 Tax=Marinicella marina TaxID=2996016 RepID=UPI002260EEF4|nr:hypothetical protein [Marinicella marina]MCX7554146.1 hypothetical protein [Marinicella marina]MDJ1141161.1 hypothetical protein [Marinicella marina]
MLLISMPTQAKKWQLSELDIQSQQGGVMITMETLTYVDKAVLNKINYFCPDAISLYPLHQCKSATFSFDYQQQNHQLTLSTKVNFASGDWFISLSAFNQQLLVEASSSSPLLNMVLFEFNAKDRLSQHLEPFGVVLPDAKLTGSLALDVESMSLTSITPLQFSGLNYEYSDDVIVAGLGGEMNFTSNFNNKALQYGIELAQGEMLLNELYVDFSQYTLALTGEIKQLGEWYEFIGGIENQQSLSLEAQLFFNDIMQWRDLKLKADVFDAFHFNQNILSGILGIYGFGGTELSGQFAVNAQWLEQTLSGVAFDFNDMYMLNERRKLSAESLTGRVNWQLTAAEQSKLAWQSLELAGLPVQQAEAAFSLNGADFLLSGPHTFPVFDGAIDVTNWQMNDLFSDAMGLNMKASIRPISLRLITAKMGWPLMAGKISGIIPGMSMNDEVIEFQGALNLDVFEGIMVVDHLSMERLFGVAPVIAADVDFKGFDLSLLTETFGFGLITGKLNGIINGLRITNWKTDRLDAEVYTVKTKGIKQTISQRAIDNISSLGGIQGAISKTFLRFFDDFRYSKIKLSCKLHNSVCEIGGMKNTSNQFTIVEGGGIPNINIVGYVRSINWDEFISRLLNANYEG